MKKTRLAALFMCLIGLIFALTGVACTTDDVKEEWSFTAKVPVACEEGDTVSITLNVENVTGWTATYEVTKNGESVAVSENGEFTPTAIGEYVIKVVVTYKGENQEKTYKLNVIKDATAPVVTSPITDKTAAKGEYNFAEDLASIVATDNKTAAENLKKSIVSVTLDGAALTVSENVCTFERAGKYNVSYKVEDEEGNSVPLAYTITVNGLYLNEKAFASETFQLAEYEIASVRAFGYENATVNVELTQDGETRTVAQGDKVKFVSTTDVTLKYTLVSGEEEKDVIEKTVKVTALDIMFSTADFSTTEGEEIIIPTATLSHETEGVTITVKVSGQYQEEKVVAQGEKIIAARGVTDITYTAENEDKSFSIKRVIRVIAASKGEFLSFEAVNGVTPDIEKGSYGEVTVNTDEKYVKVGSQSAKLVTVANTWGNYSAGFAWAGGSLQKPTIENANAITFWMYSEKEIYIYTKVTTGDDITAPWVSVDAKPIALKAGWNFVTIDMRYSLSEIKKDFNIANGLQELYFRTGDAGSIIKESATLYIDNVCFANLELPDGLYFTFDSKPASTGKIGSSVVATAPRMLVEDGVTLTVTVTSPDGQQKSVEAGGSFNLEVSGYYTLTYKAEKEGKPSQEEIFQILVSDPGEFLSFELINGSTPDIEKGTFGQVSVNTDEKYVKVGSQSAKLVTTLAWSNYSAGFSWNGSALQKPTIDLANGITFWMYSEKGTYLYTYITTGVGDTWATVQVKPIELKVGWNYIAIDIRCDLASTNEKFSLANGLQELFFRTGDANAVVVESATLYIDNVCFAKLELPEGVYFTFDSKPASTGTINGKATVVAPKMLVTEGVTLTAKITAPDGTVTDAAIGDEFTLTQSGRYIVTYKAEKEGKPSQEIEFEILVPAVGEFLSFETVNGATPDMVAGNVIGNEAINKDAQYVKSGSQSAKLMFGTNRLNTGHAGAGFFYWEGAKRMPNVDGATGITFWVHSDVAAYLFTNISTGGGSDYTGAKQSKPVALKAGWNFVTIDFRYDMAQSGININNGISELWFRIGSTSNAFDDTTNAILYLDCVCFAALPERVVENLAIDFTNIALPADKEFGNIELCTDEQYTKNGKPSLMLEMTANEVENKNMRACYSSCGKGIMLTSGENAVKFEVYASRAGFVSFEFGTGGNAGSGAYGGVKFAKVIELQQGWNTVTITFDATGASGDVNGAVLADGIVHFGATAVKSLDSAVVGNDHYVDVATEPLTLYVSTMYAIKA